jgi:hypothetical protein
VLILVEDKEMCALVFDVGLILAMALVGAENLVERRSMMMSTEE